MNKELRNEIVDVEKRKYKNYLNEKTNFKSTEKIIAVAAFGNGFYKCYEKWQESERWRKVDEELPEVKEKYNEDTIDCVGYSNHAGYGIPFGMFEGDNFNKVQEYINTLNSTTYDPTPRPE